ncbi:MAG: phage minor capsid protein, partial [Oscillospiraceae bacterium]
AEIKQTHNACWNYTQSLGFAERNPDGQVVFSSLGDFLINQMDAAHMKVVNGVTDYNTAIRQACSALAASGVRTVYYNSGHSDRIEVAVRRAVMTSVSQVTQKISEQNAEEFGADGWEISAHAGARPSHAIYQGRQYPNSKYETIVRPLIEDYNCRHSAYPIIMGVSEPAYTEEELANIDPPPFTYEGRTYTAYEAQQQMRKMERAMRKQKDRCIVADAAGDEDTFTAASIKLRRQKDIYEDFCNAAGTYTEYERTFVAGYNRSLAAKTGAVTRKQRAFENAQITLTDLENGGIIESRNIDNRNMANGQRRNRSYELTSEDISYVKAEAESIGIPTNVLKFNSGNQTGFSDIDENVRIKGDVFPDENSTNNRDTLSVRAVLAHEYYGHYKSHPSPYDVGDWRDEFYASYNAAVNTPNLSDEDRAKLMIDAYDRAKEAGEYLEYDDTARRLIYGYSDE